MKYNPDLARIVNEQFELEEKLAQARGKNKKEEQTSSTNSSISSEDFWTIDNVNYRNELYKVDLLKQLLDNGQSHTQDEWSQFTKKAKEQGEFYVGDMPLYHALFTALYNQREGINKQEIEKVREFIQKQMREKWLMTLTRIAYQPRGKDKIIHNYGMNEQYSLDEDIVGQDRFIEAGDKNALKVLLGVDDVNEINSVYQFINNTNARIWRLNSKPNNIAERVSGLYALSGGAVLDCNWDSPDSYPVLGVRAQKI